MDKDKLYQIIDDEEDMTDQEKRDAYFSTIEEQEAEEHWQQEES